MKKENNRMKKFVLLLLVLTIIALILVSSTYAKYTTTASASSVATIAKWDIVINEGTPDETKLETATFDLFETIVDTVDDAMDTEVANDGTTNTRIAPGTKGEFSMTVTNNSEVDAQFGINFTQTVTGGVTLPIVFSMTVDGGTATAGLTNIAPTEIAMGATKTIVVSWEWPYETGTNTVAGGNADQDITTEATGDAADTIIGIAARTATTITIDADITATQLD